MTMRRASLLVSVLGFALFLPLAASAQDARELFQRGQTAYQQGDYETAIQSWTQAYELDARPLIQFNLAQAFERLNRLQEAAAALDRYLETADPSDANQADARARRSALRERLGRTGLVIEGGPAGASIVIDDREWGVTPRPDPIRLDPGSHRVVLTKEGFRNFRSTVVVPAGETVTVTVEMEEAPSEGETRTVIVHEDSTNIWPWIMVGAGGALVVVGALVGFVALGQADEGAETSARALAGTADALGIVGGLVIGAGLTWFFLDQNSGGDDAPAEEAEPAGQPAARLRITPALGPTVAGAVAEVTF
jgi:hypothetical protein